MSYQSFDIFELFTQELDKQTLAISSVFILKRSVYKSGALILKYFFFRCF